MQLNSRRGFPIGQKIWMKDIENVFVDLSPRPWDTQTLGQKTIWHILPSKTKSIEQLMSAS